MNQNTPQTTEVVVSHSTVDGKRCTERMKAVDYITRFEAGEFYTLHKVRKG